MFSNMNMSVVLSKKCNIELQNFVDVLRSSATVFDEFEMELNRIVIRIGNLSSKLAILENIKDHDVVLYPIGTVRKIISMILLDLNSTINRAHELIRKLDESIKLFQTSQRDFSNAANVVRLLNESALTNGSHDRKTLEYYVEESFRLLHSWKRLHQELSSVWRHVNARDIKTLENVRKTQESSLRRCQESMEDYLMYCSKIIPNKRNK